LSQDRVNFIVVPKKRRAGAERNAFRQPSVIRVSRF